MSKFDFFKAHYDLKTSGNFLIFFLPVSKVSFKSISARCKAMLFFSVFSLTHALIRFNYGVNYWKQVYYNTSSLIGGLQRSKQCCFSGPVASLSDVIGPESQYSGTILIGWNSCVWHAEVFSYTVLFQSTARTRWVWWGLKPG